MQSVLYETPLRYFNKCWGKKKKENQAKQKRGECNSFLQKTKKQNRTKTLTEFKTRVEKTAAKMLIMFQIICTLMKLKEENNEYFDSFGENVLEVSRKIFNDNCVDNGI